MPPEEKSQIEELKKSLYSRTAPDVRTHRKLRFRDETSSVQKEWERPADGADGEGGAMATNPNKSYEDHSMSFFTKLLIGSAIFCVIAVGIGAYLFFNGTNMISADNIDIKISGPVSIPGGEPVSFDIAVTNKNNVDLQLVDMSVNFPAGTTDPADPAQELRKYTKLIGDLGTGSSASETVQAIIFGEENMQKQVVVSLTYSIKGSTAVFTKTKSYDVLINSSPILVTASSFKEITSGQEFDIKVDIKSNSGQTLKNILLTANYPAGFVFISSNLRSVSADNTVWRIGDIPAGAERNITIHGKIQGENSDVRTFRFSVGAQDSLQANRIGTEYMNVQNDISIQKPFVSVAIEVDNDGTNSDFVTEFDRSRNIDISWFNNLSVPVSNVVIVAHLSGNAYSKEAVVPENGYFRSTTDDIIWNQQTTPELASVAPGDTGKVSFSITPKDLSTDASQLVNPTIIISANISGDRTQESEVPESLSAITSRNIHVSSRVSLSGRIVRSIGPFINSGPIPPQAEQETTYTVLWAVDNTSNSVGNAKVTATIPAYVKWLGNISPSTEALTFDNNSGTISWDIGSLAAHANTSSRRREVAFQISFLPGVDLVGSSPVLVNPATLTALDSFTNAQLESSQGFLITSFSTDPSFKYNDSIVVR